MNTYSVDCDNGDVIFEFIVFANNTTEAKDKLKKSGFLNNLEDYEVKVIRLEEGVTFLGRKDC